MRLVVLFDLPTKTPKDRKAASRFRGSLKSDGFDMVQYSVYSRICANHDVFQKHMQRVKKSAPKHGSIRMLAVTEHQFTGMHIVAGEKTINERKLPTKQLTIF